MKSPESNHRDVFEAHEVITLEDGTEVHLPEESGVFGIPPVEERDLHSHVELNDLLAEIAWLQNQGEEENSARIKELRVQIQNDPRLMQAYYEDAADLGREVRRDAQFCRVYRKTIEDRLAGKKSA